MRKVQPSDAIRLIYPRLTVLVTTIDDKGNINAAPYSWIVPVSFDPPLVSIGIGSKEKHTYINAKRSGEFVVNVVSEDFAQQAVNCEEKHIPGDDLLKKNRLYAIPSEKVDVPKVKESRAVLECRVKDFVEIEGSDHVLLIGEVVAAQSAGDIDDIRPLLHCSGDRFRSVGKEIILERKK